MAADSTVSLLLWALGGVFGGFAIFCVCAAIYVHCHREVPSSEGESGERSSQSTTRRSSDWDDPPHQLTHIDPFYLIALGMKAKLK